MQPASSDIRRQDVVNPSDFEYIKHQFGRWCVILSIFFTNQLSGMKNKDIDENLVSFLQAILKKNPGRIEENLIQLTWDAYQELI